MLSMRVWLDTKQSSRFELVKIFNLKRSGGSHVVDDRVMSDGHTDNDIAVITVKALQDHLKSTEEDFYKLYYESVFRIEHPHEVRIAPELIVAPQTFEDKDGAVSVPSPLKIDTLAKVFMPVHKEKRIKGCTVCDSKGWRHKTGCRLSELTEKPDVIPQQAQSINAEVI